jgi:HPr kinase/phosphorylase
MTPLEQDTSPISLHASCIIIGEQGVLIRGESGSGKSQLAVTLMRHAQRLNRFAALVSDDRTLLSISHGKNGGRLIARPHPSIPGLIERRGTGLVKTAHEPSARIDLVIDLIKGSYPPRMPTHEERTINLAGLSRPRIVCSLDFADPAFAALGLDLLGGTVIT